MEVRVNSEILSDRPYQGEAESVYTFNETEVNAFANEIIYGNQACYLVSGYRGAGKTSFINRTGVVIEQRSFENNYNREGRGEEAKWIRKSLGGLLRDKSGKILPESYDPVFVYTSFAKYNNQTAFLRQLIRSLYLSFTTKPTEGNARISFLKEDTCKEFRKLYDRTFFDIKSQHELSEERKSIKEYTAEFSVKEFVKGLMLAFGAVLPSSLLPFLLNYPGFDKWIPVGVSLVAFLMILLGY